MYVEMYYVLAIIRVRSLLNLSYLFAIGTDTKVNISKGSSTNAFCNAVFLHGFDKREKKESEFLSANDRESKSQNNFQVIAKI
jgi:hypothetical protein